MKVQPTGLLSVERKGKERKGKERKGKERTGQETEAKETKQHENRTEQNKMKRKTYEQPCFSAGNLVFHGPREDVVPYFQSLGFYVPERKAVSDFLQEVTSKKDQKVGDH